MRLALWSVQHAEESSCKPAQHMVKSKPSGLLSPSSPVRVPRPSIIPRGPQLVLPCCPAMEAPPNQSQSSRSKRAPSTNKYTNITRQHAPAFACERYFPADVHCSWTGTSHKKAQHPRPFHDCQSLSCLIYSPTGLCGVTADTGSGTLASTWLKYWTTSCRLWSRQTLKLKAQMMSAGFRARSSVCAGSSSAVSSTLNTPEDWQRQAACSPNLLRGYGPEHTGPGPHTLQCHVATYPNNQQEKTKSMSDAVL